MSAASIDLAFDKSKISVDQTIGDTIVSKNDMDVPVRDAKAIIMEKVLHNFDLLSHICCYLDAESIVLNCGMVNKSFLLVLLHGSNKTMENHFRMLLVKDFKVNRDARMTRSQGYYRQLYLDCREEQIMEDNLICGGH